MSKTNKIVRLGLEKTVEDLISRGITTSTAISAELAKLGKKVSQPTMSRYLKGKREARKEETKTIMDGHINEHLPADLTALETMEAKCLEWAGEENKDFANRLADQHVMEAAPRWMELISSIANDVPKEKIKAVKEIINQCLSWTANDLRLQTARIAAMKQASSIIDMKLRPG